MVFFLIKAPELIKLYTKIHYKIIIKEDKCRKIKFRQSGLCRQEHFWKNKNDNPEVHTWTFKSRCLGSNVAYVVRYASLLVPQFELFAYWRSGSGWPLVYLFLSINFHENCYWTLYSLMTTSNIQYLNKYSLYFHQNF